ncbi:MAG TPA: TlpA disulfide reductase family protein [Steroidobacteraceae bacterium]|nr:TlpA disulfide reductase family protein [Steroidobacteraceae bacterium]
MRFPALVLSLFAALTAASVGASAEPPAADAPRWPALQQYAGKVVLLDFWASWCSPCLKSFPWMNELQKKHGADGLVVLAVNVDQDRKLADAFLGKTPAQFKIEFDPNGTVARQFDVQAMPTSFLIDRQGKVRVRHAGFKEKNREQREQQIAQLLKEPAA